MERASYRMVIFGPKYAKKLKGTATIVEFFFVSNKIIIRDKLNEIK